MSLIISKDIHTLVGLQTELYGLILSFDTIKPEILCLQLPCPPPPQGPIHYIHINLFLICWFLAMRRSRRFSQGVHLQIMVSPASDQRGSDKFYQMLQKPNFGKIEGGPRF